VAVVVKDTSFNARNIPMDPMIPRDLRPLVTFWALLRASLDAYGKGSTVATFTRATVATHVNAAPVTSPARRQIINGTPSHRCP